MFDVSSLPEPPQAAPKQQASLAQNDGEWADAMFGCAFRNVTGTHGCAELGKTSCFPESLAFGLHFVDNEATEAGPRGVADWDGYQQRLNTKSFSKGQFNGFMHYALVLYTPDLTAMASYLVTNGVDFLARKGQSPLDAGGGLVRAADLHTTIDVEWFAPALVDAFGARLGLVCLL